MSSRIEQIIEEIEEYVESCKYQPLSTTKIIVNKEEIEELLRELRLKSNGTRRSSATRKRFCRTHRQRQTISLKIPRSRYRKW